MTFAFFAVASHVLDEVDYKGISLLWSVLFIVTSVIYRPIEQLLSRSIAERRALGHAEHSLRVPLLLQGAFALAFLAVALPLREPLWRGLNMARGAYIKDLGNTPGHLNHWSKRSFVQLLSKHGEVVEARSPFPWTMLLVRVGRR